MSGHRLSRFKLAVLVPLAVFVVLVTVGVDAVIVVRHHWQQADVVRDLAATVHPTLNHIVRKEAEALRAALVPLSAVERLTEAFRRRDRDGLLEHGGALFDELRRVHDITHMYFITPDRRALLRVHQPDRHGDRLDRETARRALADRRPSAGLEIGPLGTFTLRAVAPWFRDGELIGAVELGKEIDHIVADVRAVFGVETYIFVPKNHVARPEWEAGMRLLGRRPDWDRFESVVLVDHTEEPEPGIVALVDQGLLDRGVPRQDEGVGGRVLHLLPFQIPDLSGRHGARLLVVKDVTEAHRDHRRLILGTTAASTAGGLLLLAIFWVILDGMERRLRASERRLIREKERSDAASEAKSHFLHNISHELRTPLNAILGFAEGIQQEILGPADGRYRGFVDSIVVAGHRLRELIQNVLDIASGEMGAAALDPAPVALPALLSRGRDAAKATAAQRGVDLRLVPLPPLPAVAADEAKLLRAIGHLLDNAIRHTEAGGTVTIAAEAAGPAGVAITITDTGAGMSEAEIRQALTLFDRIERRSMTRHGSEGLGVGLPLARHIAELHGGGLEVRSAPGEGTTIILTLPTATAADAE